MTTIPSSDDQRAGNLPDPAQPTLSWAERLFAQIVLDMAKAGAVPADKAANVIAYLAERRAGEKAP